MKIDGERGPQQDHLQWTSFHSNSLGLSEAVAVYVVQPDLLANLSLDLYLSFMNQSFYKPKVLKTLQNTSLI